MNTLFLVSPIFLIAGLISADQGFETWSPGGDIEVQQNQPLPVFASCQLSGNGTSDIYWLKPDGQRVKEGEEGNVYSSRENRHLLLIMRKADEDSEGEYVCFEEINGETVIRERFTFHAIAKSPPVFDTDYVRVEAYEETNVTLVCGASGELPIKYTWLDRHSSEISDSTPNVRIYKGTNSSELHLLWVSNATSGVYTCAASNRLGTNSKLYEVVVTSTAGVFRPFFNETREAVYGTESLRLTLICRAEGRPKPTYTWYDKNGIDMNKNYPRVIDRDQPDYNSTGSMNSSLVILVSRKEGSLTFTGLNASDGGNYKCKAENPLGVAFKDYSIYVNSSTGTDEFPPYFEKPREEISGFEGRPLTLTCQAKGNPPPEYIWYNKYGEQLSRFHPRVIDLDRLNDTSQIKKNSTILVSNSNGTITFVQLQPSDDGHYTCYAENAWGRASKTYRIYLNASENEFPPYFKKPREEILGIEGRPLNMTCKAEGNPLPRHIWYDKYGQPLNRFHPRVVDLDRLNDTSEITWKNTTILVSNSNRTITFVQLQRSDDGNYTCYAENTWGRASKKYRILLNDSEIAEDHYITARVQNVTDDSVTFEISASRIYWVEGFEAQYRLANNNKYQRVSWPVGEDYRVSNLLPGAKYYFQFTIRSRDNWTDPITVALAPPPPEIIVRQVSPRNVKLEFFRPIYFFTYNTIDNYIIKYRTVQLIRGNTWSYSSCEVEIKLSSCSGNSYEISNLNFDLYYSISVQAEGPGGYSKTSEMKVRPYN